MPAEKVVEFILKNHIEGTFDINSWIRELSNKFAVTRYMIEIRFHELNIHFTNGIYIKNFNRYRSKKYTEDDLLVLLDIAKNYSLQHGYYDADNFCQAYNMATRQTRASGPLYMVLWRIFSGYYDKYSKVFEKRVSEFQDINFGIDTDDI
jgi:hypothetical protein